MPRGSPATDPRTHAQRVLDTAADLLLAGIRTDPDGHPSTRTRDRAPGAGHRPGAHPARPHRRTRRTRRVRTHPRRHRPTLAAHAPSFHRILTHPETGAYLSYSRTTYRVPADLARYLRTRDGTCRFPGCGRRATTCDLDHTTPWNPDGHTRHDNLAHLCRNHHRLKHHTRWRMTQHPDGTITWTSPTGRHHTTHPEHPFTQQPVRQSLGIPSDAAGASLVEVA